MKAITPEELVDDFSLFDDFDERCQFIVEIGDELPPLDEEHRKPENIVQGCQSQVWLVCDEEKSSSDHLELYADSDAHIVKGLITILLKLCLELGTAEKIKQFDFEKLFDELELKKFLLNSRSNGLASMVKRIREIADGLS